RLRGRNSKWTQNLYKVQNADAKSKDSRFWFLTGTPIVRDVGDVYPFLHLMDRQIFSSYHKFVGNYAHLEYTPWETLVGDVLDPERFQWLMSQYSIRRLQSQIPSLAGLETIDEDVWVDLPPSVLKTLKEL